ncbi:hypothetical protein FB45DRAFT_1062697 [Roridomyces roridus]|uniref:MYND-type domain-containing protein n=1 Tax=Roridomyces roridus TaxID=1738132 RepID=A0AAD7BH40_9AGAR|nr:hypothetical protein FB45DRAFT_1062697 [Roridomyces roridus]
MHSSLDIQHIASLPEPTKSLAKFAAGGAPTDVDKLEAAISNLSESDAALCIPAFYAHLNVDDLPLLREQLQTLATVPWLPDRLACALLGLKGLGRLERHLAPEAREEVWASVWLWIQFLEGVNLKRTPKLQPSSDDMRFIFVRIIIPFTPQPKSPTLSSFMSQPRMRELMSAGWAAALNLRGIPRIFLGAICTVVAANSDMADGAQVRDVVASAGGTMDDLASLIVRSMRRLVPSRSSAQPDAVLFRIGLMIIPLLGFVHDLPLKEHLVSHGSVDVICTVLCVWSTAAELQMMMVVPLMMPWLLNHMEVFPYFTRVKEALEGGLLRAIVLSAGRKEASYFEEQLETLLGSVLPQSLVYHSVLASLRAALDEAEPLTHNDAFRKSKFFTMWQDFVRLATDRLELLAKFDRGEIGQTRACDTIECTSPIKAEDDLKRCSECHSAFYCSRECQIQEWAHHKKLCPSLLERENELAYLASEVKFLRAVLNHDYEHARADVVAKRSKALETHPDAVVIFDYRHGLTVQIECGVAPAEVDRELIEYYGDRVNRSGERLEMHVMALNVGKDRTEWLVLPMCVEAGGMPAAIH